MNHQQLLLTVINHISSSTALDEILSHVLKGVADVIQADGVRLVLTGAEGHRRVYAIGEKAPMMAEADAMVVDLMPSHALNKQPVIEIPQDVLPTELKSGLAAPLMIQDTQYGVVWGGCTNFQTFDALTVSTMAILAMQAALVIRYSLDAARKKHEWLGAVLTSTPDPVLVVDRDLHVQLLNPAAQHVFPTLLIGQSLESVSEAIPLVEALRAFDEQEERIPVEFAAEDQRVYALNISDVQTEFGVRTGWVLTLRDISHFKRLHDNMSEFLSTVSHDMRSPLTFMKGYLDMLSMVGELNEKQEEFVYKIAAGVDQMSDMVEKILEAGKLDPVTGTYQLSREASDVVEIIEKAVSGLIEPAARKQITLTHVVDGGIPILNIDKTMLASAFTNLIENAVKYTPEGGHIEVELGINGRDLLFRVTDDGFGISEENQKKLFERNVRVHRKEWKRIKGSGLGLFIVKNVAQRHGGDAWVESVEGEGSTFYLAIPLEGANLLGGTEPLVS
ncbi:MAG: PAS domain-containing protein [Anaerolineae bacterium]|nr:PAS domain-containing protein [Anaerolineae bacterium]